MANYSSALMNALGGAATGGSLGSLFGPVGTGIGAVGGGLTGGLSGLFNQPEQQNQQQGPGMQQQPGINPQGGQGNWFSGYSGTSQQFPRFNPQQISFLQQMLQQAQGNTNFDAIENQYKQNFETNTVPSLAERFAGTSAGPGGSSRFRGALGAAGAGLNRDLAALRSQYGLQQGQLGLQPMFENIYIPGQAGAGAPIAQAGGEALTKLMPLFMQWLQQYMNTQQGQQSGNPIRQQNIQQGYQPLPRPNQTALPNQFANLPQLKGL